jgi:hypothetical protein
LRHLEQCATDAIAVADADLVVRQAIYGKIFTELPEGEIAATQGLFPVSIRVDLVDHHGALLAAVTAKIPLCVPCEVKPSDGAAAPNRTLPNAGVHRLAAPPDVLW